MTQNQVLPPMDRAAQDPGFAAATRKLEAGQYEAARVGYQALTDRPQLLAPCLHQLGLIAGAQGDAIRAMGLLHQALAVEPGLMLGYRTLAEFQARAGREAEAMGTLLTLGNVLKAHGRVEEALSVYAHVLERDALHYGAAVNMGTVLANLNRPQEATYYLLWGLRLYARRVAGLDGLLEQVLARLPEVARVNERPLPPGEPSGPLDMFEGALTTLGSLLRVQGHHDLALAAYRQAVQAAPGYALGHWNLSLALLSEGSYREGWREYEWRWQWPDFPEPRRSLRAPVWQGEPLAGCRILVWSEQGQGDIVQCLPLISPLLEQGAEVVLEVPRSLVRLLAFNLPQVRVIERADAPNQVKCDLRFDYVVPLMSLPHQLGVTLEDLPLSRGYLKPLPDDLSVWQTRLPAQDRPRIGLVWAGRPQHRNDAQRSLPFAVLQDLVECEAVHWYSLQVGPRQSELERLPKGRVTDLAPHLEDFGQTAAALAQLDAVVTVDTSVAHLAGAMGECTWVLLPEPCDWRWGQAGDTCAWYPTVRLFRQAQPGQWATVVEQVKAQLASLDVGH